MRCEICEAIFLNSDEFNAHTQVHLLEGMREWAPLLQGLAQSSSGSTEKLIEAIAQRTTELILARMPPSPGVSLQVALPPAPRFSFEVRQLAIACINSGRSAEEVIDLCHRLSQELKRQALVSET